MSTIQHVASSVKAALARLEHRPICYWLAAGDTGVQHDTSKPIVVQNFSQHLMYTWHQLEMPCAFIFSFNELELSLFEAVI
jgi:hypothetical protein